MSGNENWRNQPRVNGKFVAKDEPALTEAQEARVREIVQTDGFSPREIGIIHYHARLVAGNIVRQELAKQPKPRSWWARLFSRGAK